MFTGKYVFSQLMGLVSPTYDQTIMLNNHYASKDYPEKLRMIKFKDYLSGLTLIFLTNNFHLKATDIACSIKPVGTLKCFSNARLNGTGRDQATPQDKILLGTE